MKITENVFICVFINTNLQLHMSTKSIMKHIMHQERATYGLIYKYII